MQIQTDSVCGLISSGRLSDLTTLRIAKVMLLGNSSQANRLIPNQYLRLQHPARENVRQAQMGVGGIHLATINSEIL